MIEKIIQLVENSWHLLPTGDVSCERRFLFVTKFCQRIVGKDTKVLFLVTHKESPICIIKMTRDVGYNEKLKHEKQSQESGMSIPPVFVPVVYFDGTIDGHYIYAEEVVEGSVVSERIARKYEKRIAGFIASFPFGGSISSSKVVSMFAEYISDTDKNMSIHLKCLKERNISLETGFTHSDFERPNILHRGGKLHIIDWGRAGDAPFRFIDLVYFIASGRRVKDIEGWKKVIPIFTKYTGMDTATAEALYCIMMILKTLRKKHSEKYFAVVKEFSHRNV